MSLNARQTLSRGRHHVTAFLFALAISGLLFPPAIFAQPSPSSGIQNDNLTIDRTALEEAKDLPSHLRITDPKTGRDLLLIKADRGYYYSDVNQPEIFGYFDFSAMEGAAQVKFDDQGDISGMTIPTRDAEGKMVDTPIEVTTDPETGAMAVWMQGQEIPTKLLSAAAGPDLLIHASDAANPDKAIIIIITIILVIIGCILHINVCANSCRSECAARNLDYAGVTATGCGRVTCTCSCERRQPELPPECI